jgi:uncharacterized membrane protein YeaQ/YmgE (transglycosylase-associated protein family)
MGTLLTWVVVGLVSGWLATALVGGPYGIVGNSIVGMVGSFWAGSFRICTSRHRPRAGVDDLVASWARSCCGILRLIRRSLRLP